MDQESASAFPDLRHDPDFSPRQVVGHKSEHDLTSGGSWHDQEGRQRSRRFQVRIWVVSLGLLALGLTLGVMVGTMALRIMGFGLFDVGDHVIAWLRQGSRWR